MKIIIKKIKATHEIWLTFGKHYQKFLKKKKKKMKKEENV